MLTTNINKKIYTTFGIFSILYVVGGFFTPADPATLEAFEITETQLRLITLPAILMIVAIWAFTAYGFAHFKQYAQLIKNSADGKGINTLANGLGLVALQLVLTSLFSTLTSFEGVEKALGGSDKVLIMSTYLGVLLNLAAFYLLAKGAHKLASTVDTKTKQSKSWISGLVLLAIVYVGFIIGNYPVDATQDTIYNHIPLGVAIVFLALPNIIGWYLALATARDLSYYESHVNGIIYKSALKLFARGMYVIVASSIFIQTLGTMQSSLEDLALAPILIILYLFIFAIGLGFLFIAQSAKKLRKIEEL